MPTESRRDRTNPHNLFKMGLSGLRTITENLHLEYPNPGLNNETDSAQ